MFKFLRKRKVKKQLLRRLEALVWEFEMNAAYDASVQREAQEAIKETEAKVMAMLKEADGLKNQHTTEARAKKKEIDEQVNGLRENVIRQLANQISAIRASSQSNRLKATDLKGRREFIKKNF